MADSRHPYGIIDPSKIPETADRILDEFFQITKKLEIRACLAYGTCLGFVRDKKYIIGDNDLDVIAVCDPKQKNMLSQSLQKAGFAKGRTFPANNHFPKDKILLDIWFRESKGFYFKFGNVKYKGKVYSIPHPVGDYLTACYTVWKTKANIHGRGHV